MKIDEMIKQERKDPEFDRLYEAEGEKLITAIDSYRAREEAGLKQSELAKRA